jgi:transcriptional regulator with XRE-family HTH domain
MPTKPKGAEIRRLREEMGINCSQLADAAGIDRTLMWKVENELLAGSPKTRLAIAAALGVPLTDITYFEPRLPRTRQAA